MPRHGAARISAAGSAHAVAAGMSAEAAHAVAAAVSAAEAGADTLLLTSGRKLGGALAWRNDPHIAELITRAQRGGVRLMTRSMAFGIYDHNLVCACESLPAAGALADVELHAGLQELALLLGRTAALELGEGGRGQRR